MMILKKKTIDSATLPAKGYHLMWDKKLSGFGLRVYANGKKDFIFNYRNKQGRSRRITIGLYGAFTADEARKQALAYSAAVSKGSDPAEEESKARHAESIKQLCELYLERHSRVKKKPRSVETDIFLINSAILPNLSARKVTEITSRDISDLHHKMRKTPYKANRVLEVLSKMFNLAETWGLREHNTNPVPRNIKYKEKKRERYLTEEEIGQLNSTLLECAASKLEGETVIAAYRLLLFTGCRLSEIQTLKWENVNLEHGTIHLLDSKTGARDVELNPMALGVLNNLSRKENNPYVIHSLLTDSHITDLQNPWQRIRKRAKIEDVRIHDLRHTFASVAIGLGESLTMVGKLLGHTQAQTTMRYAHLRKDLVKQSTTKVGAAFSQMMAAPEKDNILPIHLYQKGE